MTLSKLQQRFGGKKETQASKAEKVLVSLY